jgi:hypothetical protein
MHLLQENPKPVIRINFISQMNVFANLTKKKKTKKEKKETIVLKKK